MEKKYLLGVDIGTYESKGVLCDSGGNILDTQVSKHLLKVPKPGWAEHDPLGDWWNDFCSIVNRLLANTKIDPHQIAGIGCSAIAAAVTPVDKDYKPLRNAILYGIDTRCVYEVGELTNLIGQERIVRECGRTLSVESNGPKIQWIKNNEPEVFKSANKFTFTAGFINAKLTGRNVIDTYSVQGCTPMFNKNTRSWDDDLCKYVVPREMLPDIVLATDIIGCVTEKAARETGLAAGTPVIGGTTDAAAEAVSVGVVEPGDLMIMFGSTIFIIQLSDKQPEFNKLWGSNFIFPELYSVLSGMATTGSLTRWFRDNFARDLTEREERDGINSYDELFSEVKNIRPGSDGLIVLPYFAGERMPIMDHKAKGVIFGLNLTHRRGHVFKASLEGIGYGLCQNLDLLREAGFGANNAVAVGGGTKSPEWMQIMSDICGCSMTIPEITVGAAFGDAILAGLGVGLIESRNEVKKWIKEKYRTVPNMENHQIYNEYRKMYSELYQSTKDIMHSL